MVTFSRDATILISVTFSHDAARGFVYGDYPKRDDVISSGGLCREKSRFRGWRFLAPLEMTVMGNHQVCFNLPD